MKSIFIIASVAIALGGCSRVSKQECIVWDDIVTTCVEQDVDKKLEDKITDGAKDIADDVNDFVDSNPNASKAEKKFNATVDSVTDASKDVADWISDKFE